MKNSAYPNLLLSTKTVAVAVALIFGSVGALAQQSVKLSLNGAAEVPAVATTATGSGEFWVAADHTLSGKFTVSGMTATAAHIHEGAAGKDGPVTIKLVKNADGSFAVPPGTKLTDAQYKELTAGSLYVNVHSAAHPGGEIRAQLLTGGATSTGMPSTGY
jgi:hypothetical protein